ncbi:sialic acid-binding Ig-like lectin 11 isoform X2 [Myotis daubentonii]|uniref:sialic acid-binding Ig-like lectin 11 isoform X2 n=1 Tax=Myotis daubentonii TaxID=98922 RepID=UPI002873C0F7|nr:sialic acid-binding Ig-like lectin 11 isoform X2 [Myotis daubentonii]
MVPLLLLPLLWGGSLQQQQPGYKIQVQESVTVQEGLCVHVPCAFSYPWSSWNSSSELYTYWYRDWDNTVYAAPVASNNRNKTVRRDTRGRFLLADPTTNNCSLDIRDARRSDSGHYVFRVERGDSVKYNYVMKKLDLQVTALTEKPHIHVREPLESGRPTQLACSLPGACEGGRPLTFSWAGAAVDSLNPQTLGSRVLTFTPSSRDHGTSLTCQVKREGSQWTTQTTILLNVSYAPQNLTIGVSFRNDPAFKNLQTTSLSILEGEALRLLCEADSNPPAELSWFRGSPGLNATPLSSTAILELPRVGPAQEGEVTCQARHPLGSHSVSLSLSMGYPPQLLGPSCSWEDQGLHCSCSSRAQPAPSLRWRLGAGLLEGNHGNASHVVTSSSARPWTNSSLSLREGLSPDLRLSCEAWNVHGAQSASVLLLPGQGLLGAEATEKGVGKPALREAFVLGAVTGAGVVGLLGLCLIVFLVKTRRRGAPRAAAGEKDASSTRGSASSTRGSASSARSPASSMRSPASSTRSPASLGGQRERRPGSQLDHPPPAAPPAAATPASGEELELYYATLSFQGPRPGERPDEEATTSTEYAEIKIRT